MLTVLSMSPAIDRRIEFETFRVGETNRALLIRQEAAGKGVNVALSARALGLPAFCLGLLAGGCEELTGRLTRNGVPFDFLPAPGLIRTNLKLYDRSAGVTTEVNEPAPEAPDALLSALADRAVEAAKRSRFLVLTGSLPTGCPHAWYAGVIRRVRAEAPGCRCALDADGGRFKAAVAEKPWLVKPNLRELEQAAGKPLHGKSDILRAARDLCDLGVEVVAVSMGGEGAMIVGGAEAFFAEPIRANIRTTTGAGDAMVAGLLQGFWQGGSLPEALAHGVAAATARCEDGGDAYLGASVAARLLSSARIARI